MMLRDYIICIVKSAVRPQTRKDLQMVKDKVTDRQYYVVRFGRVLKCQFDGRVFRRIESNGLAEKIPNRISIPYPSSSNVFELSERMAAISMARAHLEKSVASAKKALADFNTTAGNI